MVVVVVVAAAAVERERELGKKDPTAANSHLLYIEKRGCGLLLV